MHTNKTYFDFEKSSVPITNSLGDWIVKEKK